MTTTLKRVDVGNVGDLPGRVLLQTTHTQSEVQATGFIDDYLEVSDVQLAPTDVVIATMANYAMALYQPVFSGNIITLVPLTNGGTIVGGISLGGDAIYAGVTGNLMEFKGIVAGSNIALSPGADFITISGTGGGGGFAYEQALWVSQANGSDGNAGTSIDTPLATVQAAVNLVSSGAPVIIYVVDANQSNNESIVTPGLGYTFFINAPGTSFQGSITQASGDEISLNAAYVDAFLSNSSSPTYLYGGEMNVTTSSTGTLYATLAEYFGTHTGGGTIFVTCNLLSYLSADNTIGSFITAPYAQDITNAGTLNIWTNTPPGSCIVSNTGTITGMMGNIAFNGLGVAAGNAAAASYNFPTADGTADYFLQTDGAGTVSWAPGGGGGFAYENTYWVSQANGSDSNAGTSIDTPFLTIQQAINTAAQTPSIIYVVDVGYTNSETLATLGVSPGLGSLIWIYAPGTYLNGGLTTQVYDTQVNVTSLAFNDITNNGEGTGSFQFICGGDGITGTFTDNGSCTIQTTGTIANYTGAPQGTIISCSYISGGTISGGSGVTITATNSISSFTFSAATEVFLAAPTISSCAFNDASSATTSCNNSLSNTNDGSSIVNTLLGNTILSGFSGPSAIAGDLSFGNSGAINYTQTSNGPTAANQVLASSGAGPNATTSWVAASGYTPFAYQNTLWVSQANGNDSNLGTSIETPLKTFQAAITLAASASTLIYGVDCNESNAENLTISSGQRIYISAPGTYFGGAVMNSGVTFCWADAFVNWTDNAGAFSSFITIEGVTYSNDGSATATYIYSTSSTDINSLTGAGASAQVFAVRMGGVNIGSGATANITASVSAGTITNAGTLYAAIANNTAAITNTGNIYGYIGEINYGPLGVSDSTGSAANYTLTSASPTAANQVLVSSGAGPSATTSWSNQGGYTPHAYTQAFWVDDINGSDSNSGLSIELPFLTYTKAFTVASTTPTIIYGVNANTNNTEAITTLTTGQNVFLQAPGTTFTGAFTIAGTDIVDAVSDQFTNIIASGSAQIFGTVDQMGLTISGDAIANISATGSLTIAASDNASVTASSDDAGSTYTQSGNNAVAYLEGNWYSVTVNYVVYFSGSGIGSLLVNSSGTLYINCASVAILNNSGTLIGTIGEVGSLTSSGTIIGNVGLDVGGKVIPSLYGPYQQDAQAYLTATTSSTATHTTLASAGQVDLLVAPAGTKYKITNIYLNYGGTNFAGLGGDRNLALTDGTTVYTVIASATLLALSTTNAGWGSTTVPFPASAAINTSTSTGANLYLQYSGGSADYTSGSVTITIEYARVV